MRSIWLLAKTMLEEHLADRFRLDHYPQWLQTQLYEKSGRITYALLAVAIYRAESFVRRHGAPVLVARIHGADSQNQLCNSNPGARAAVRSKVRVT